MKNRSNHMNRAMGAILLAAFPSLAHAQTQVPAIQANATAGAAASVTGPVPADQPAGARAAQATANPAPPTMPPPIPLMSPSRVPLNTKERTAVALSRRWANRGEIPRAGEDGYVRFLFGAALPTVVCAPLRVCNLALQPGEIVNNLNLGDSVRWKITPSLSGIGATQTTHLIIKATDAGLVSSLDIETDRRTYAVKLVSTQSAWMPLVAFNYPDDAQTQWQAYRQSVGFGSGGTTQPTGANAANLQFLCVSGDGPSWTPIRAYTDGTKTTIEFPDAIRSEAAPALVALANDGSWFSSPSTQIVNYRVQGNRYVVDAALDRAALISGVGSDQRRVTIARGTNCR
jgi:type IV secretion system protein TrbG